MSDVDQGQALAALSDRLLGAEPQGEPVSPEVEDAADDAADQSAEPEQGDEEVEQQAKPTDEVEIEVEGWKGKIPKKLHDEINKGADYTRKTQEIADYRRVLDAQQRARQEEQAFYQAASQEMDRIRSIDVQLEQYRKVDLSTVDQDTLSRMSMAAANLREEKAQALESVQAKKSQFKANLHATWDQMANSARDAVSRTIPNWDKESGKVAEFLLSKGVPFEVVTGYDRTTKERVGPGVVDPAFAQIAYEAMKWNQLQASKTQVNGKAAKAPPVLKPGATDTRGAKQVSLMNYRKELKAAGSDAQKAQVIQRRLESKSIFKGL